MRLTFDFATPADAPALVTLHTAASNHLTQRFGHGFWSSPPTERGVLANMRFAKVLIARNGKTIAGTLRLANKKPWAIDVTYFTPVKKAIYLTSMAVLPSLQRKGVGRQLIQQAITEAKNWPANAIRLDAFNADAGAGGFYASCGFRETARVIYRKNPLIYYELLLI